MVSRYKVGDVWPTKCNGDIEILKVYYGSTKADVRFKDTGTVLNVYTSSINKGLIKDPNRPVKYGVAFLGQGPYKARDKEWVRYKSYTVWEAMISRCYDTKSPNYNRYGGRGVTVHEDWLNFQNFCTWWLKQQKPTEPYCLDKDILNPDSKQYSEANARLIPRKINSLVVANTGSIHPTGVYKQRDNSFGVKMTKYGKGVYLGCYSSPELAFDAYKTAKEEHIKVVAEDYYSRGEIQEDVYKSLINWEVEAYPK